MAMTLAGIPDDFSEMVDSLVAVSYFKYPHHQADIRNKVLTLAASNLLPLVVVDNEEDNDAETEERFIKRVVSLTYDGAPSNEAFSPDDTVRGISAEERRERRDVSQKYRTIEETKCFCHRNVNILVHIYTDADNEVSAGYKRRIEAIYYFFNLISSSQKNEQVLIELQEADVNRIGRVLLDVSVPVTRWNYNSRRLHRIVKLWTYASVLQPETTDTVAKRADWSNAKLACEDSLVTMKFVLPVLSRFQYWIVYFQSTLQPTISLVLYMIADLEKVIDNAAEAASTAAD